MNVNNLMDELFSLTDIPTSFLTIIIVVIILKSVFAKNAGIIFRDIPKYLCEIVIATFNFILALLRREQINYPPHSNPPTNDSSSVTEKKVLPNNGDNDTTKLLALFKSKIKK